MTRPLVTYADVEEMALDHLGIDFEDQEVYVRLGLPNNWSTESEPCIQVACDGTPRDLHPVAQQSTIRVTVWAQRASDAKAIANEAHGRLLARHEYKPLTGLLVAHDDQHDAELASFTVRAQVRSVDLPTGS